MSLILKKKTALKLIKIRSEAMQKASEEVPSGLASVFITSESKLKLAMVAARRWCMQKLKLNVPVKCEVASYLYSQCRVIGANNEALDFIELNRDEFKLKRLKRLAVSGAFHTSLMSSAEEPVYKAVQNTRFSPPLIRFYSNYDAQLASTPSKIRHNLVRQIAKPVKWEQTLNLFFYDENLSTSLEDENNLEEKPPRKEEENREQNKVNKKSQSPNRFYPDIYECGPASQSGPIIKVINRKAHEFYKHIEV